MPGVTVYLAPLDSLPPGGGGKLSRDILFPYPGYLHPLSLSGDVIVVTINYKQFDRCIDLLSDYNFIIPAALTAKKHTNSFQGTYVYKLSTSPPKHFFPVYSELDGPSVANHGDDINFIFGPWFQDDYQSSSGGYLTATNDQENVGKSMITL